MLWLKKDVEEQIYECGRKIFKVIRKKNVSYSIGYQIYIFVQPFALFYHILVAY